MEVRRNVENLIASECELRHSAVAAVQQNGTNQFTFLIFEDQFRSEQIRPVVTSAGIGAVAKAAVRPSRW